MAKIFTRTDSEITKATIGLFREEVKHDKKRIVGAALFIPVATTCLTVIIPLFLSLIVQSLVTQPSNLTPVYYMMGGILLASITTIALNDRGFRWLFDHEEYITTRLTKRAVDHLLSRSHSFFADHRVGSLTGDVIAFTRSYLTIMDAVFLQMINIVVNFVASLIIIAFLSPILLIPLAALTLAIALLSARALTKRAPLRNERKRLQSHLNGTVADILGNSLLVRIFARPDEEVRSAVDERNVIDIIAHKEVAIIQREANIRYVVLFSFQLGTMALAIWLFSHQAISIAALIFAVTYLGRITGSLFNITGFIRQIEQGFLDAAPITKIMLENVEVKDAAGAKELKVTEGKVEYKSVGFHYSDNEKDYVFNNMTLAVPAGQRIGLAGHSGGGKTTFSQLLLRFSDLQKGEILIDGQDISKVTQASLHKNIAYVPQDPFLFHRTLRENIAYGKPDASDDEVRNAAKKAHAMEFIDKLPKGLDTVVGERGVKLSGGQRQRVAIARAILKDAPILVLDEATSALDSESEKLIQASLSELMKGRTAIVIAHRLSTIAKLDRIVVLEEGKIIEDGPHSKLLSQKGTYANLWSHQSGGFIDE